MTRQQPPSKATKAARSSKKTAARSKAKPDSTSKPETAPKTAQSVQSLGLIQSIQAGMQRIQRVVVRLVWKNRYGRILLFIWLGWLIFALAVTSWYQLRHRTDTTELGVSYSLKYAEEMGIDWQEGYVAMLDEVGFRRFRLMSYWDLHEPQNDVFDFEKLDWMFNEAHKRGAIIDLAIGERQPRWPECHHPEWAAGLIGVDDEAFNAELFEYIEVVVRRYKDHPALARYQLENEIFNNFFGECQVVPRERVQAEYDLVKRIDSSHPVVINVSNQSGIPVQEPIGDEVGFSIYFTAWGSWRDFGFYYRFWYVPPFWHSYRAGLVELIHGTNTNTFVHELQTEPWGPGATVNLTQAEQAESMTVQDLAKRVRFAEQSGMSELYLWGAEWWHWRETSYQDSSFKDEVKRLISERPYQF